MKLWGELQLATQLLIFHVFKVRISVIKYEKSIKTLLGSLRKREIIKIEHPIQEVITPS